MKLVINNVTCNNLKPQDKTTDETLRYEQVITGKSTTYHQPH